MLGYAVLCCACLFIYTREMYRGWKGCHKDLECRTVDDIYMDKQTTALHSDFRVHGNIGFFAAAAIKPSVKTT